MTRAIHITSRLLLVLLLILTGQALAVARGAPLPTGQVELCTGTGPVMVFVDEDGQPVRAPHYCPEGVLSLLHAVALPELAAPRAAAIRRAARLSFSATAPSLRRLPPLARGPPRGLSPAA
ncbi:hypothetical protein [Marinibacterium profundimaris]|uniref:Uncharacterized protein n=1 Tax=Marinibacterium profundimaris TaxID=1679460 RepID=A0A225NDU8_9RHOB|nr:hypothetical protein [Marinibacterium profundimaris]OWU70460.1 hypothetical protein ATO3_20960 [Marinibacterium profundimaris]